MGCVVGHAPPLLSSISFFLSLSSRNRYVGNKMATFALQALGCDVAAINTVNFSKLTAPSLLGGWFHDISLPKNFSWESSTCIPV